ncbi:hypothetical protein HPC49_11505 [Pyxidicoccus fallax]|uniref:Leucine-rich repeat domain-containing protein n=1 Tax=Pyxidicoccus fallax TaxID=394095 RepID=A0A848LGZ0_9BACT|nr:hypothetical protein [Pyxidicoccus fallax]NMO17083.1 hypothetical protein [Pyxidicoccus fallax]NPC78865.1 hypothetical protein [Pyxidicoccus fallax]
MWEGARWVGGSDEELFATVRYDPAPHGFLREVAQDAPGLLRFRENGPWQEADVREQRLIEVLQRLRSASGPRATELRSQVRSLTVDTWPRLGGPFDVGWLTGLAALERVTVYSNTGITRAAALAELPALRHATLYAFGRNEIRELDGVSRCRRLESLNLYWGGLRDLRALSGLERLRRLAVHANQPLSLTGIEELPLEELELWLTPEGNDLTALTALRSLRSLDFRGQLSASDARVIARCRIPVLRMPDYSGRTDPAAIAALPDAQEIDLRISTLSSATEVRRLPMTSLDAAYLTDAGLRLLANAPRLRTLRVHEILATDLTPLVDLPELRELRFNIAREFRSLDQVPRAVFLPDPRQPDGPNRLVLQSAPLTSIRQLGNLRGVEHLDLRNCTQLMSLWGLEGMNELKTLDLRDCPNLVDMTSLEALPALRAVMVNHRGPTEPFPSSIWPKVVRNHLRGFVRRLHRGEVDASGP